MLWKYARGIMIWMYHFNPISECELFENMETQYLYYKSDKRYKTEEKRHVYWYQVNYIELKKKEDNVFKKGVLLNKCSLPIKQGNCIVPEGVTSIGKYCFEQHSLLTSIQLPSTLISIGECAFYETNISTVIIPEEVTEYECKVPLFIKNILKKKGIECPNCY